MWQKIFCMILLLFCPLVVFGGSAAEDFSSMLSHYQTFSAHFVQTTRSSQGRVIAKGRGQFWLKRPDQFRWQTTAPDEQIIVGDGRYLWNYDVDLMQVTKQKFDHMAQSPVQILLGNVAALSSHYQLSQTRLSVKLVDYLLSAKTRSSGFTKMIFHFRGHDLIGLQLDNALGQQSDFRFTQLRMNPQIDDQLFRFSPPKGVDILDNTDGS